MLFDPQLNFELTGGRQASRVKRSKLGYANPLLPQTAGGWWTAVHFTDSTVLSRNQPSSQEVNSYYRQNSPDSSVSDP